MIGGARSRSVRRQTALAISALSSLGIALAASLCAPPAIAAGVARNPGAREVALGFDKTEPGAAVSRGIPVHRGTRPRRSQARVIYSVAVPRLGRAEKLRVRGVVELTHCNGSDQQAGGGAHAGTKHSPCELLADPYSLHGNRQYVPRVAARLFLGSSRSKRGRPLGHWQVRRCDGEVHHCPLVIHTHLNQPPDRHRTMHLNLAVTAFDHSARLGRRHRPVDVVELNGECKHHDYNPVGDRRHCVPVLGGTDSHTTGELKLIRFGAARSPSRAHRNRHLINHQIQVRAHPSGSGIPPRIILRQRVRGLSTGDVVDASAGFHLRDHPGDGYVFRHFVRAQLFLSGNPTANKPRTSGRSPDRWISGSAGTNCPHRSSGCEIQNVGAITVPQGAPHRMWVEYAAYAVDRGGVNGAPTDVSHGRMTVAVDQASRGR